MVGENEVSASYPTYMETIGSRIKLARTRSNLSQQEVADHFGIARVSVTQWELDRTKPEIERLSALASLLQTTPEWILDGAGDPPPETPKPSKQPTIRSDREISAFLRRIQHLNATDIQTLEAIIKGMRLENAERLKQSQSSDRSAPASSHHAKEPS